LITPVHRSEQDQYYVLTEGGGEKKKGCVVRRGKRKREEDQPSPFIGGKEGENPPHGRAVKIAGEEKERGKGKRDPSSFPPFGRKEEGKGCQILLSGRRQKNAKERNPYIKK